MLLQFGLMGSVYMQKIMGMSSPRVGLINIGTEERKGLEVHRETYHKLQNAPVNFIGNVEARGLPLGECDVAVCDGFTGNVVLKLIEGMAKFFSHMLKDMLLRSTKTKIAALLLKDGVQEFKSKIDASAYGGAPLLGISKMVIKAHGNSDARAIQNAIRQAKECIENGVSRPSLTTSPSSKSRQRSRKKRITTVNQGNLQGIWAGQLPGNQTPLRCL